MADEDVASSPDLCRTQIMPRTETPTRHTLIDGVQKRSPDRWAEFHSIYRPMLVGYFRKQGLSDGDVQDLVQDVFLKLCRRIHTYDREKTRFRTWLFTVGRNTLIDHARRALTRRQAVDGWVARVLAQAADDEEKQRREFEKSHHARILQFAFEKARARSKPRVWDSFEMTVIQRKPGAEVAEALGISCNSVYVNSWRVLRYVKEVCRRYDEDLKHEPDERLP